jgi:hypothetical protein
VRLLAVTWTTVVADPANGSAVFLIVEPILIEAGDMVVDA